MKLNELISSGGGKSVYRDGDACIKVFDENYSKADVLNEALNQARVESTGINIPRIREVAMIDGKWAIVSDFIEGKTLARLMEEDPDRRSEYLERMVDVQVDVLSHKCAMLGKLRDKMNRKIDQTTLDATTRYDLHTRIAGMPKHDKLCHGDFNPSNVIITPEGEAFVIDWSHATQGNGSADAARTYLMFCLRGEEELAKEYLDMYCKKTDTAKQYVQKWMPIVAASQSVKGNAHEREFLLGWVDVVDYE